MADKRIFNFIFICSMLFSGGAAVASAENIRVGTEGAYYPFNYIDAKGTLLGFDIDIAKALCAQLKRQCTFVTQDWDGMIPALLVRKFDLIIASMTETDERRQKVSFSHPYYHAMARFVAKKNSGLTISAAGLKGKTIGCQRGTPHADYLKATYGDAINLKLYDTQENVNLDLQSGRLDAVLADAPVMYTWLKEKSNGKFEFVGEQITDPKFYSAGIAIAFRKSDQKLVDDFNQALATIQKNGVYDKIRKAYFPFDIK